MAEEMARRMGEKEGENGFPLYVYFSAESWIFSTTLLFFEVRIRQTVVSLLDLQQELDVPSIVDGGTHNYNMNMILQFLLYFVGL